MLCEDGNLFSLPNDVEGALVVFGFLAFLPSAACFAMPSEHQRHQ
jgi:hypothetical protein